jgi:hypothetical protein
MNMTCRDRPFTCMGLRSSCARVLVETICPPFFAAWNDCSRCRSPNVSNTTSKPGAPGKTFHIGFNGFRSIVDCGRSADMQRSSRAILRIP